MADCNFIGNKQICPGLRWKQTDLSRFTLENCRLRKNRPTFGLRLAKVASANGTSKPVRCVQVKEKHEAGNIFNLLMLQSFVLGRDAGNICNLLMLQSFIAFQDGARTCVDVRSDINMSRMLPALCYSTTKISDCEVKPLNREDGSQ